MSSQDKVYKLKTYEISGDESIFNVNLTSFSQSNLRKDQTIYAVSSYNFEIENKYSVYICQNTFLEDGNQSAVSQVLYTDEVPVSVKFSNYLSNENSALLAVSNKNIDIYRINSTEPKVQGEKQSFLPKTPSKISISKSKEFTNPKEELKVPGNSHNCLDVSYEQTLTPFQPEPTQKDFPNQNDSSSHPGPISTPASSTSQGDGPKDNPLASQELAPKDIEITDLLKTPVRPLPNNHDNYIWLGDEETSKNLGTLFSLREKLIRAAQLKRQRTSFNHCLFPLAMDWSSTSEVLGAGSMTGVCNIWDMTKNDLIYSEAFLGRPIEINNFSFIDSPFFKANSTFICSSMDGELALGSSKKRFNKISCCSNNGIAISKVSSCRFNPFIISYFENGSTEIIFKDIRKPKDELIRLGYHESPVQDIDFSCLDEGKFLSMDISGNVAIWDLNKGQENTQIRQECDGKQRKNDKEGDDDSIEVYKPLYGFKLETEGLLAQWDVEKKNNLHVMLPKSIYSLDLI